MTCPVSVAQVVLLKRCHHAMTSTCKHVISAHTTVSPQARDRIASMLLSNPEKCACFSESPVVCVYMVYPKKNSTHASFGSSLCSATLDKIRRHPFFKEGRKIPLYVLVSMLLWKKPRRARHIVNGKAVRVIARLARLGGQSAQWKCSRAATINSHKPRTIYY